MGKKNKDKYFWESARKNNAQYIQYYNRLTELAISRFDWKNVPDTIDIRFLELTLYSFGQAVFFKDDVIGYLALRNAGSGSFDVYNVPKNRRAIAVNGYNQELTDKDSVIIYNNLLRHGTQIDMEIFAERLYNLDIAIDVNANAQKTPILVRCDETERLTMEQIYMQYNGNIPVIFGDKSLNPKSLEVLRTDAPYVGDKLYDLKTKIWNEALTVLGITNVPYEKKERLLVGEVERGQGGTISSRYSALQARKEACEKINKMFGLNMDVEYKDDAERKMLEQQILQQGKQEGTENKDE